MTDTVVLPWDLTESLCYSGGDYKWDVDEADPSIQSFESEFLVLGNQFLAEPDESWYQGVNFISVIQRKSDSKRFGYPYWEDISKHGEAFVEPNGDEHGLADDEAAWLPVTPFTVAGYQIKETKEEA